MRMNVLRLVVGVALLGAASMVSGCAGGGAGYGKTIVIELPDEGARFAEAERFARDAEQSEDVDEAIVLYVQAVRSFPLYSAAWNNMGILLMKQDRHLEAAEAFAKATELSAMDPRPMYNLGLTWDERSYPRDALKYYKLALERDGRYLPALRGAIRAEHTLGEADEGTLDRIRMALGLERSERWREYFLFQRSRAEQVSEDSYSAMIRDAGGR